MFWHKMMMFWDKKLTKWRRKRNFLFKRFVIFLHTKVLPLRIGPMLAYSTSRPDQTQKSPNFCAQNRWSLWELRRCSCVLESDHFCVLKWNFCVHTFFHLFLHVQTKPKLYLFSGAFRSVHGETSLTRTCFWGIQKLILALLFILAVFFLYNKFKKNDDNCGNGNCDCD